ARLRRAISFCPATFAYSIATAHFTGGPEFRIARRRISMALTSEAAIQSNKRLLHVRETRTAGLLNFIVILAIAAVAYPDWVVVPNVSLGYLYVLPIALCALINPLQLTVGLVVICTFLTDIFGPPPDSLKLRIAHNAIALGGFLVVGFLVTL